MYIPYYVSQANLPAKKLLPYTLMKKHPILTFLGLLESSDSELSNEPILNVFLLRYEDPNIQQNTLCLGPSISMETHLTLMFLDLLEGPDSKHSNEPKNIKITYVFLLIYNASKIIYFVIYIYIYIYILCIYYIFIYLYIRGAIGSF